LAENQAGQDIGFVSTEALTQAIVDGQFSLESASAENLIVLDAEAPMQSCFVRRLIRRFR
jgi:hypothetical protein